MEGPSQYCSACFLPFCPRCDDGCGLAAELRLKNNYLRVSALANEAGKCLFRPWMTCQAVQRGLDRTEYRVLARSVGPPLNVVKPLMFGC
jgi:hypothetical protein